MESDVCLLDSGHHVVAMESLVAWAVPTGEGVVYIIMCIACGVSVGGFCRSRSGGWDEQEI